MPQKFIDFIKKHHVLTLATSQSGLLHCANVFYAFLDDAYFVFASHNDTLHIQHILCNNNAAANIYHQTSILKKIQGLQMRGIVYSPDSSLQLAARKCYLRHFPYAVITCASMWIFEPTWAKFTDNLVGFGNKMVWNGNSVPS
jgi:uncharacterized protein YhbP (UPF0306 family)